MQMKVGKEGFGWVEGQESFGKRRMKWIREEVDVR